MSHCACMDMRTMLMSKFSGTTRGTQSFSTLSRPIHLSEVSCTGEESTIFECMSSTGSGIDCTNNKAGVICQGIAAEKMF